MLGAVTALNQPPSCSSQPSAARKECSQSINTEKVNRQWRIPRVALFISIENSDKQGGSSREY